MTKYAAAQILFALVLVGVGVVKAVRILIDEADDALCDWVGLS